MQDSVGRVDVFREARDDKGVAVAHPNLIPTFAPLTVALQPPTAPAHLKPPRILLASNR